MFIVFTKTGAVTFSDEEEAVALAFCEQQGIHWIDRGGWE